VPQRSVWEGWRLDTLESIIRPGVDYGHNNINIYEAGGRAGQHCGPGRWDDPTQKLLLTMVAAFAEFEKSLISSRLSAGRKTKARQGGYAGGKAPIGYRAERGDNALQLDEEKVAVVKRVFELRDSMPNASLQKLADTLNAEHASSVKTGMHRIGPLKFFMPNSAIKARAHRGLISIDFEFWHNYKV